MIGAEARESAVRRKERGVVRVHVAASPTGWTDVTAAAADKRISYATLRELGAGRYADR